MIAVSGALVFAGYQLICYGWDQVRGGNNGFFDILWPGRFKNATPDTGTANTAGIVQTSTGLNDVAAGGTIGATTPTQAQPSTLGNTTVLGK
jgi:hypothetical protein